MRFRSPAGSRRWAPQLAATVLFAALCGVATYWGLQLFAPRVAIAPAGSLVDWQKAPDLLAASRLFGMPPSAVDGQHTAVVSSNIKVVGVAASPTRGSAVLSIDGKPPKAFLAGEKISENALLVEVRADAIVIEQAGGRIELPAPPRPDPAVLSSGPSRASAAVPAAPVQLPSAVLPQAVPPAALPTPPAPPPAPPPASAPALPPADAPAPAVTAPGAAPDAQPGTEPPPDDASSAAEPTQPATPGAVRSGVTIGSAIRTAALREPRPSK